jgi:hypothetical protein
MLVTRRLQECAGHDAMFLSEKELRPDLTAPTRDLSVRWFTLLVEHGLVDCRICATGHAGAARGSGSVRKGAPAARGLFSNHLKAADYDRRI